MDQSSGLENWVLVDVSRIPAQQQRVDGTLHMAHVLSHQTFCGTVWTARRPFLPLALWGSNGFRWCPCCAEHVLDHLHELPEVAPANYHPAFFIARP